MVWGGAAESEDHYFRYIRYHLVAEPLGPSIGREQTMRRHQGKRFLLGAFMYQVPPLTSPRVILQ